jgi:hypothetical protein
MPKSMDPGSKTPTVLPDVLRALIDELADIYKIYKIRFVIETGAEEANESIWDFKM